MRLPPAKIPIVNRAAAAVSLSVWLLAVAHCTADCCSDAARFYFDSSHPVVAGADQSHQAKQPGHHDHCFCDSLHSVCPAFPATSLVRPAFGLATGANLVTPARPLLPTLLDTLFRCQPPDCHRASTPEVYLGPAFHSLAPPLSSLS